MARTVCPRPLRLLVASLPLVLALVACGDGTPERTSTPGPAPEAVPAPEQRTGAPDLLDWRAADAGEPTEAGAGDDEPGADAGDTLDPSAPWPGIDDDPSFDHPPGSGDWCGTGMRNRPMPGPFRDVIELVETEDGRVHLVTRRWSPPDPHGIRQRRLSSTLTKKEIEALEARREEIELALHEAEDPLKPDPDGAAALRTELARIMRDLERKHVSWVQFARMLEGVVYHSTRGETVEAFRARTDKEHAAHRRGDAQPKDAPVKLPDPFKDASAGRLWTGPDENGFWRRLIDDPRPRDETKPSFGPDNNTIVQWGLDRDGVFYTSKPGESAEDFLERAEREAKAKRDARAKKTGPTKQADPAKKGR